MATIKDVALTAEVSVGTVSKVLSGDPTVKKPARDRVMAAVAALGYRPNLAARALRTNRVDVIGLVVPDISNPFFAQLAKAIETEAAKRGHMVMLANSHDDRATEQRQLRALLDRAPRGIVVCAVSDDAQHTLDSDTPILSLDRRFQDFPLISTDHAEGSAQVADHLFALGHRNIAYIAGPQETSVARARLAGFQARIELLRQSEPALRLSTYHGHFGYQAGEDIARQIFSAPAADRPTAIAAASDQLAIGVLRCARDMGIEVPRDVSVTGFDDIELAALVVPRLTTLRQPTAKLAAQSIAAIFGPRDAMTDALLPGELIIRSSTSAAAT
jgi:LacI family transcriptional regulator